MAHQNKKTINKMISAGLFAALITITTAYIAHIPIGNGYLHFGDTFIFLAAALLPAPYACFAAAAGAGLADLLTAPIWAIATIVIKAAIAFIFTNRKHKIICKRNLLAGIAALFLTVGGYYVAEALIYGNWAAPMVGVVGNIIQVVGSMISFVILGMIFDKMRIKEKYFDFDS